MSDLVRPAINSRLIHLNTSRLNGHSITQRINEIVVITHRLSPHSPFLHAINPYPRLFCIVQKMPIITIKNVLSWHRCRAIVSVSVSISVSHAFELQQEHKKKHKTQKQNEPQPHTYALHEIRRCPFAISSVPNGYFHLTTAFIIAPRVE